VRSSFYLFRALGQGAFGEVYQGYFKKSSTDSMEMPVAVKTLPELSTNQGKFSYAQPIRIIPVPLAYQSEKTVPKARPITVICSKTRK
jgi:hypothetical protein